jgi:hypothetical protein
MIQETFGVIEGTFSVIQGTFGVIQGTFGRLILDICGGRCTREVGERVIDSL